ncbi:MAG: hypothetical protein QOC84_1708 [Bradyrhizobium sp.]|jgi:hypothetical protein|nr:hypothetical protein [Bradyrhizobium sp.]
MTEEGLLRRFARNDSMERLYPQPALIPPSTV